MTESAKEIETKPILKLDLGCGKNKREGFIGVDSRSFDGVDQVVDLSQRNMDGLRERELFREMKLSGEPAHNWDEFKKWPWEDESVEEVVSSHFVEHLEWPERVHFFNELYRILVKGGKAQIITPHWAHACFYGDPTHKAPMSEWYVNYLNKSWRDMNAPHVDYTCDFDFVLAGGFDEWLASRSMETRIFAMARYINSTRDLIVNLTKR